MCISLEIFNVLPPFLTTLKVVHGYTESCIRALACSFTHSSINETGVFLGGIGLGMLIDILCCCVCSPVRFVFSQIIRRENVLFKEKHNKFKKNDVLFLVLIELFLGEFLINIERWNRVYI